jgi:ATP phosphoribosyltransferase
VREYGNVGFVGSDVVDGVGLSGVSAEWLRPVAGCRLALLALPDKAVNAGDKLSAGEGIRVGTSYPVLVERILGEQAVIEVQRSGSVESLPGRFPWLDGVVELVRSGESAAANGLVIVEDNLYTVGLMGLQKRTDGS